jgi:hypothetical protein
MRRVKVGKPFELSISLDDEPEVEKGKRKGNSRKRHIAVGEEFDASIKLTGNVAEATDAVTRARLVWVVLSICAVFLFGAALLGLYKGGSDFSHVQAVWTVVGPTYGGIAGYFFWRKK